MTAAGTVRPHVFVGVDLAERYSAAVVRYQDYDPIEIVTDFGPATKPLVWEKHSPQLTAFAAEICHALDVAVVNGWPTTIAIEDVHHRAINSKPAIRMQGALLQALAERGFYARTLPVNDWQKHFGYKKVAGTSSKGWAKAKCVEMGYEPVSDVPAKPKTDLRDAYLISHYLEDKWAASCG